jgi:hypothetical protein
MAIVCTANIHGCATTQAVMLRHFTIVRGVPFFETTVFELERKPQ